MRLIVAAVLHFVGDEDQPDAIVSTIRDALPAGRYLELSRVSGNIRPEIAARSEAEYKKVTRGSTLRTQEEIIRFFTGLELVEPGLVPRAVLASRGGRTADADKLWFLGAVGRSHEEALM